MTGKTSIQRMVIALMVIGLFVGSSPVHVTANGPKILEFETMVGVPAGLTGAQQRPIHGVNGAGRPWVIGAAKGELTLTGKLELEVGQVEFALINPSCYQRKLRLVARTNNPTFSSNPLAVTAWIDLGNKRSSLLPVVSTIFRMVDWR